MWTIELALPGDVSIPFRYFVASIDPCSQNEAVHVRRWESHLEPRVIPSGMDLQTNPDYDTFGTVKGVEKIDKGWLTNETILQFKFFSNPFALKERIKNRLLYVKVSKLHITYIIKNMNIFADTSFCYVIKIVDANELENQCRISL